MEYDYKKMDRAVAETIIYFHDMCAARKEIVLLNFNRHSLSHHAILQIATIAGGLYGMKIYVNCGIIDYLKIKKKYKKKAEIRRHTTQINGIFCEALVRRIENKVEEVGILKKVYEAYYGG